MRLMLSILIFTFLFSCRANFEDPNVQKMYDEVMFVHDEVMPEISTINKLKRQIKKLEEQDSLSQSMISDLANADEMMMSWMADFKPDKSKDVEAQLDYLSKEKIKIDKVSVEMKSSILAARNYLNLQSNE